MAEASMPSSATMEKVRMPTSLFDHSRSMPTSIPTPTETAIFSAMGGGGKCVTVCIGPEKSLTQKSYLLNRTLRQCSRNGKKFLTLQPGLARADMFSPFYPLD
jgi:hypothetical protein